MLLSDRTEDAVPVGTTEMSGSTKRCNSVFFSSNILNLQRRISTPRDIALRYSMAYDDVVHIIFLDLRSEVNRDLDTVLGVLFFNGVQERVEPFGGAKVTDDPGKVDL